MKNWERPPSVPYKLYQRLAYTGLIAKKSAR